jgi:hypothetical protein
MCDGGQGKAQTVFCFSQHFAIHNLTFFTPPSCIDKSMACYISCSLDFCQYIVEPHNFDAAPATAMERLTDDLPDSFPLASYTSEVQNPKIYTSWGGSDSSDKKKVVRLLAVPCGSGSGSAPLPSTDLFDWLTNRWHRRASRNLQIAAPLRQNYELIF